MRSPSRLIQALLFLALAAAPLRAVGQEAVGGWSQRGVFAFDGLLLDFQLKAQRAGMFASPLADCTSDAAYCAKSQYISLVLPKTCDAVRLGAKWEQAGVRTEILASTDQVQGHLTVPGQQVYFAGDASSPGVLFAYVPRSGVIGIFFDPTGKWNFYQTAKAGKMGPVYQSVMTGGPEQPYYHRIVTLDPMGACRV